MQQLRPQLSNAAQAHYDRCSEAYKAFVGAVAACAFAQFVAEFEPLAQLYADFKRQAALLDFDDLLYHARDLLAGKEHVRQALAQRYGQKKNCWRRSSAMPKNAGLVWL